MIRTTIAALLLLGIPAATAGTSVTGQGVTLTSTAVSFPASTAIFPGANADAINANCVTCHSPSMVLNQPPLTKEVWAAEVSKMRKVYGAPVAEADVPAILNYLTALPAAK